MKIVTSREMREIDLATSRQFGVSSIALMENAGSAVAEFVERRYPLARSVGVICGKGNNGGDGLAAARKLHQAGREVRVLLLARPSELSGDAAEMLRRVSLAWLSAVSPQELEGPDAQRVFAAEVLLDAILGAGFRPPASELYAAAIARLNASTGRVVAIDVPSGTDADQQSRGEDPAVHADAVVTFTAPRPAHVFALPASPAGEGREGPPEILVASIGSPPESIVSSLHLQVTTAADIVQLFAPRPPDSNKGNFGHVLVLGGSLGKAGAAAMAGIAALRAGTGLSTVGTPKSVLAVVSGFHPELMTEPLEETEEGTLSLRAWHTVEKLAAKITVLAVGPGLSRHPESADLVRRLVAGAAKPMVLDADGLNAFEGQAEKLGGRPAGLVITPHPGEMARLLGSSIAQVQRDRIRTARGFAREHDLIVVLKGHRTLIAKPDGEVWVNHTGNPGMATGGTGDVLTGIASGLVAQNPQRIFEAVVAAVYLHGLAGDVARERNGEQALIATDLIAALPEAIRRVREAAGDKLVSIGRQLAHRSGGD